MSIKNKMILLIIAYLAVLADVFVFVICPSISRIQIINQEIHNQKVRLEKLYLRGQLIKQVKAQLAEIDPLIEKLAGGFVDPEQSVRFIETLEKTAREFAIVQKIDLRTEERIGKHIYEILPVRLSLEGDFINLIKYLSQLEEMGYYFNIDSLSIAIAAPKYEEVAEPAEISVLISARSYWSK